MNFLDIFLVLFLIIGLIKGYRNGFFVELASLVSVLLGIYIAIKFSYLTKYYLEQHVSWNPKTIQVMAFALTFILVILAVSMLAKAFTAIANFASLGILNNLLGAFLGFLRAILVLSVLLNLFQKINFDATFLSEKTKNESVLYEPVQEISKTIYPAIATWFDAFRSKGFEFENSEKRH
jgi:membrane protein required for colicin V production